MDVRNAQGQQQAQRLGNGGSARRRPRLPLDVLDPLPVTAMRPAWRSAAQAATVGIFIILLFAALSLARPIVLPPRMRATPSIMGSS